MVEQAFAAAELPDLTDHMINSFEKRKITPESVAGNVVYDQVCNGAKDDSTAAFRCMS